MLNGYQIIDADSHAIEPPSMWEEYLEPAFKRFAPSQELKFFHKLSERFRDESAKQMMHERSMSVLNGFDSESHVRAMKQMGVECTFLYPNVGLVILAHDRMPSQLAGALIRAYNNWLRDFCSYNPKVLKGVGAINLHAPEEMIPELKRIAEFGWKTVFLHPNPIKGRLLSDAAYEDFWTKCEEMNIAVGLHAAAHSHAPTTGVDRFNTEFAIHACSHPMEQMMALLALIEGGVLERHPKLRVGFLESGCGWLPYWLWRLDEEYENLSWEVKENVRTKPSEYFRRQCFVTIEPSEYYIPQIIDCIGSDNLMFGSDYPHVDHAADIAEKAVALEERLSKEIVQKILWDNPARFYGVE